jgi:hypothetical protein
MFNPLSHEIIKHKYIMRYKEIVTEFSNWKHYRKSTRECVVRKDGCSQAVIVSFGSIETGRSRVFYGFYVELKHEGFDWCGEDRGCFRNALKSIGALALKDGYTICAAGLDDNFRETGLSYNSGWGYINDQLAHMLDPHPLDANVVI